MVSDYRTVNAACILIRSVKLVFMYYFFACTIVMQMMLETWAASSPTCVTMVENTVSVSDTTLLHSSRHILEQL